MTFREVDFSYPSAKSTPALRRLNLELTEGEFLVLVGPSGSGKSTVLRLAAGFEPPSSGAIEVGGAIASVSGRLLLPPAERRVALVFQELALWPHLTAGQHLGFAGPRLDSNERQALLSSVELSGFAKRRPAEMSGGERQRLALARALASQPRLLLLDEPFANLDPPLRGELRELLLELHRLRRMSVLYVTHDREDAFALGSRLAVLHEGCVEQDGPPETVYRRPATAFVAAFVGQASLVPARIRGSEIASNWGSLPNPRPELSDGAEVRLVVRPEAVSVGERGEPARVESASPSQGRYLLRLRSGEETLWAYSSRAHASGERVHVLLTDGWPLPT